MQSKRDSYWFIPIFLLFAICAVAAQIAPSLSGLSSDDRDSIEMACIVEKNLNGPAAYHACLEQQLRALAASKRPDIAGLSNAWQNPPNHLLPASSPGI